MWSPGPTGTRKVAIDRSSFLMRLSRQPLQRIEDAVGTRIDGDRRAVAPEHKPVPVDHEEGALTHAVTGAVSTVFPGDRPFPLEVGKQRKMDVVVLRIGLVAPGAIDRNSQYLGPIFLEFGANLIVEGHLIAADRAPIGRVERENDR